MEAGARVRAARQQAGSDPFFARNAEQNQTSSVYPTEAFKLFKLLVFDVKEGWFHQHISFEVKDTDFRGSLRSNFKDFQSSIGVVGACLPWRTLLEATASETLLSRAQEKVQLWPGVLVVLRFVVCAWDAGTRGGWSSRPSCKTAAGRKRPFCQECGTKPNKLRIPHRSLSMLLATTPAPRKNLSSVPCRAIWSRGCGNQDRGVFYFFLVKGAYLAVWHRMAVLFLSFQVRDHFFVGSH